LLIADPFLRWSAIIDGGALLREMLDIAEP